MAAVKLIELLGISQTSWEDAAQNAVKEAARTVRNIRGLDMLHQTAIVKNGEIAEYRATVKISFVVEDVRD
jgi:flavin-binding protein dodecin